MPAVYRIIRTFHDTGKTSVVQKGLSLEEAQAHCRDPESSSKTCQSAAGRTRTRQRGAWSDGYEGGTYKIVRVFADGSKRTIETGFSLEEAQAHCKSPESSSKTCKTATGKARTRTRGPWSDGYEDDDGS